MQGSGFRRCLGTETCLKMDFKLGHALYAKENILFTVCEKVKMLVGTKQVTAFTLHLISM